MHLLAETMQSFSYIGGKFISECPSLPNGRHWNKIGSMIKPGVEFFNYPVYELTEYSQARTASQASWMLKRAAGKITKPLNGDFDVVKKFGGNWLCERRFYPVGW